MFIVFEGIDGCGKTTQVGKAVDYLRTRLGPENVVESKDPGGTRLGTAIRRIMYQEVPTTEMATGVVDLLFLASHLQNWQTVVKPALDEGKHVVSDRWWYSQATYVTQRSVPQPIVDAYMDCHGGDCDLLIFLHGDVRTLVDRARARRGEVHQSSKAWNDYDVLKKVQDQYFEQFGKNREFFGVCVDGKTPDEVWVEIRSGIDSAIF